MNEQKIERDELTTQIGNTDVFGLPTALAEIWQGMKVPPKFKAAGTEELQFRIYHAKLVLNKAMDDLYARLLQADKAYHGSGHLAHKPMIALLDLARTQSDVVVSMMSNLGEVVKRYNLKIDTKDEFFKELETRLFHAREMVTQAIKQVERAAKASPRARSAGKKNPAVYTAPNKKTPAVYTAPSKARRPKRK